MTASPDYGTGSDSRWRGRDVHGPVALHYYYTRDLGEISLRALGGQSSRLISLVFDRFVNKKDGRDDQVGGNGIFVSCWVNNV
jgi:hypothetical protein